jgi:hypothetical protein
VGEVGRNKGLIGLALVAALALVLSVAVPVGGASGGAGAEIAKKKKCKKGKKKANSAKKKKCKKKKKKGQDKPPAPVVRATITWTEAGSDDADLDLFVFDANGATAAKGASAIPNSTMSADLQGPAGSETFTDLAPKPLRTLSFAVCYQVGGSVHAPFTITYITADGQSHTDSQDPGSSFHYDYPGGAPIPAGYCPD